MMHSIDLQSLQTTEVEKAPKGAPPAGNVWEKRQKDRDTDHPEIETTTSEGKGSSCKLQFIVRQGVGSSVHKVIRHL